MNNSLKFVDIFAGLGGFHLALSSIGHRGVFASEIDPSLARLYGQNFDLIPQGDIRESWENIPEHDVLCAGFPCQPFSKAGWQKGMDCPDSGDLFNYILKILEKRNPKHLILENVPNLTRHENGDTWTFMRRALEDIGYEIDCRILSPVMFGIPQKRDRAIIVGSKRNRGGLTLFEWPQATHSEQNSTISSVLDVRPNEATYLSDASIGYLNVWQEFLDLLPPTSPLPSFPIWAMEFGATYPLEGPTPRFRSARSLARYRGQFGAPLKGLCHEKQLDQLPPYAQGSSKEFPAWKQKFIRDNRAFYLEHEELLKPWLHKVKDFSPSFQKFEWNWKEGSRSIWDKIVQFRASGIRVKRPTVAPSLVALTTSQIPVIPWEKRYMTMTECARLQSMESLRHLPSSKTKAHHALGNAVNVEVITRVAERLLNAETQFAKIETNTSDRSRQPIPDVAIKTSRLAL